MNRSVMVTMAVSVVAMGVANRTREPQAAPAVSASDSAEIALGTALIEKFDRDRGVVATPQSRRIEAYLQSIADSLGKHTKRKLPWKIHYDPHPGIKSGFALPGGHIVIWGGAIAYMSFEDELAAIIAHEIEHTDIGQVNKRIDSLRVAGKRDLRNPSQWGWDEFGATYGPRPEALCDYEGAKLIVQAGYSPLGYKTLLGSYIAMAKVHMPDAPPPKLIVDRVDQIEKEMVEYHWEALTKLRQLRLPQ
jgi:predicted Zn-dependent protease